MADYTILIVDDEKVQRESLSGFLKTLGYKTMKAENADSALEKIKTEMVDIVLILQSFFAVLTILFLVHLLKFLLIILLHSGWMLVLLMEFYFLVLLIYFVIVYYLNG